MSRLLIAASFMAMAGCAPMLPTEAARFSPHTAGTIEHRFELRQAAVVTPPKGYAREVPAGSRWQSVGTLPQGTVYRRLNSVFSIQGRHVHEAYLVVKQNAVQGFFLPAESQYSSLTSPIPLITGALP